MRVEGERPLARLFSLGGELGHGAPLNSILHGEIALASKPIHSGLILTSGAAVQEDVHFLFFSRSRQGTGRPVAVFMLFWAQNPTHFQTMTSFAAMTPLKVTEVGETPD